jgi:hypothetical protein
MKLFLVIFYSVLIMQGMNPTDQPVSAQVILQPAKKGKDAPGIPVTAANVQEVLPSQEGIALVTERLKKMGFAIGNVVGNNFSITAPREVFEKVFKVEITHQKRGMRSKRSDGTVTDELPVKALPAPVAAHIQVIVLPPAPDFGPGNY